MSIHYTGRGARRGLAVLTTAAVVCGLAAGGNIASAATGKAGKATKSELTIAAAPKAANLGAGRYVVVLTEPGATRYDGGVAGLRATAPAKGKSFDAQSAKVEDYSAYLTKRQNGVAGAVGAQVMTRSTLAASSFTARLSGRQATELAESRDVLMVVEDEAFSLDTNTSPGFLHLSGANGQWAAYGGVKNAGAGTVVGVIDSGIWPESGSFAGQKVDRNPTGPFDMYRQGNTIYMQKKDGGIFRGVCQPGEKWAGSDCNSKLVGARYYPDAFLDSVKPQQRDRNEFISPRDGDGHGSHTASTAAGNYGVTAVVEGRDFGTISGMAPARRSPPTRSAGTTRPRDGGATLLDSVGRDRRRPSPTVSTSSTTRSAARDRLFVDPVEYAFLYAAAPASSSPPRPATAARTPRPWRTTARG